MDIPPPAPVVSSPLSLTRTQKAPAPLHWGDLYIYYDHVTFDTRSGGIEARGHVRVERGDEVILADSLVLEGLSLSTGQIDPSRLRIEVTGGQVSSPPYFLAGKYLQFQSNAGGVGEDLRFVPATGGQGELVVTAERISTPPNSNRLTFKNAAIRLYGVRLITLKHLTVTPSRSRRGPANSLTLPVTFHSSRLSGATLGFRLPFVPLRGVSATSVIESSSRQGIGTLFTLRKDLLRTRKDDADPSLLSGFSPDARSRTDPNATIRSLITARKPEVYPLRDAGYRDLLSTSPTVVRTERSTTPRLQVEATLQNNREFVRRDARLLLSRKPEVRLLGRLPIGGDDGALVASVSAGRFVESRFDQGHTRVWEDRVQTILGWDVSTLHFGDTGRVRLNLSSLGQYYRSATYRIDEARLAGDYSVTEYAGAGFGLIARSVTGRSPLLFDTAEAPAEGQLRGQMALGRYLLSGVGRWDLKTRRLFDSEFAFSLRGKTIEPRVSWRSQNQQFSFSVVFPALIGS